ncbi:MAG: DUF697 domain-containing protein [Sandaracinaceae bacterium]|nr:DUF697 domain-containing protein [Sandaracinaceae bacterium]
MGQHRPQRNERSEIDDWMRVVDRLPFVGSVKREVTGLRRLLYDRRAPRLAVVGAAGSGRTALANGLLNAATFGPDGAAPPPAPGAWVRIDADGRRLDWIELPADEGTGALVEMARRAFDETPPDLLVGVLEAGAPTRDATRLQDGLRALRETLSSAYDSKPGVLIVLSKVDTLPPPGERADSEPKRRAMDLAIGAVRDATSGLGLDEKAYVPVCARPYAGEAYDPRYNLDGLGEAIINKLPDEGRLEAVRGFEVGREARREVARTVVNSCSAIALTVGLAPIPFADAFVLLPLQAAMVTGIAYVSGRGWDKKAAAEWIASVGAVGSAGIGLRWGAQQLVKLVPGAGSLVGASVAGAGTMAIGRSAIAYFIDGPGSTQKRPELRADNPA